MIDLSYEVSVISDGEAFSTFEHISSTELCLERLTCHTMCQGCSIVKHCLHAIILVGWNSN